MKTCKTPRKVTSSRRCIVEDNSTVFSQDGVFPPEEHQGGLNKDQDLTDTPEPKKERKKTPYCLIIVQVLLYLQCGGISSLLVSWERLEV